MNLALIRKLLRDIRLPLIVVMLLAAGFQCLWVKITQRTTTQISPFFSSIAARSKISEKLIEDVLFQGPGKIVQTLAGGENVRFERAMDMLSIGYMHPLMQTIFCVWAVGRAASALAGELDRGTMELLLAQPLPRRAVPLAHLCVDAVVLPLLSLSLWAGTAIGVWLVGPFHVHVDELKAMVQGFPLEITVNEEWLKTNPWAFGPALWNIGALMFAVSGLTMWLSSLGRFRAPVLGWAVLLVLIQFLVNVVGQLWDAVAFLRPLTVFFYYQPQQIVLHGKWTVDLGTAWNSGQPWLAVNVLAVLFSIGAVGYLLAIWQFSRRDLPAPL